jgi:uncharacterized membrane protein
MKEGHLGRIDTFNGNYGLNRGLASATAILAVVSATQSSWWIALALLAISGVFLYRAYRFGVYYARELFMQFLVLTEQPRPPARKKPAAAAS